VDDVVQAYIELISSQRFGSDAVFNIASGKSTRIGGLLDQLLSMSYAAIEVRQDPERLRPAALRRAVGDASKLRSELGWAPRRAMNETLAAILEDKRAAIIRHTP
jgi:GDP-4-dehydro-6-deoxy-D-mannose reductase